MAFENDIIQYDFKNWKDFPRFNFPHLDEVYVNEISYKDQSLKIGDKLFWVSGNDKKIIQVEHIRIDKSIRVWAAGEWYFLPNCLKLNKNFDNLTISESDWLEKAKQNAEIYFKNTPKERIKKDVEEIAIKLYGENWREIVKKIIEEE